MPPAFFLYYKRVPIFSSSEFHCPFLMTVSELVPIWRWLLIFLNFQIFLLLTPNFHS